MVKWGGSGAFVVKNSDATSWHELLHYFGPLSTEFRKATKRSWMPKWYEMHGNVSFGPNGVDRVRSLPKILKQLGGTNFALVRPVLQRVS